MDIQSLLNPNSPGFWILISLFGWVGIRLTARYWSARQFRWLNLARWVLIPYAGLIAGSLSPQLMGLTGIDWQATLSVGIVLTAILIALMAFMRFTLVDTDPDTDADSSSTVAAGGSTEAELQAGWTSNATTILMTGAEQFQWSFLRGAVWEIALVNVSNIGATGYWAVWIATLLALPAVLLQPLNRADKLLKVTVLIISAILFVFTRNFWLCWIFHAAAWLLLSSGRPSTGEATV